MPRLCCPNASLSAMDRRSGDRGFPGHHPLLPRQGVPRQTATRRALPCHVYVALMHLYPQWTHAVVTRHTGNIIRGAHMRQVLLAGAALFALVSPAMAGVITISALDDGVAVALVCTGGINASISCDGASTHFASIDIAAAGNPPLPGASLASLTIDATAATGGCLLYTSDAADER